MAESLADFFEEILCEVTNSKLQILTLSQTHNKHCECYLLGCLSKTLLRIFGENILQNMEWFFNCSIPCSVPKWKTLAPFWAPLFSGEMCFLISLHSSFCAQVCETPILLGSSARTSRETPPTNQSYQLTYFTNYLVDSLHS